MIVLLIFLAGNIQAQDTISFPLKIRIGTEVIGPVKYFNDKNILNLEGFIAVDLNEKRTAVLAAGSLDYHYSQYNYDYNNSGFFVRSGMQFNLLSPKKSQGKYWTGIELSLGFSRFKSETPEFKQDNYWGSVSSSIPSSKNWGAYIEAAPGFKAEIFKNISIGWSVSTRMLLHTNTSRDLRPVYFPGFGYGTKTISAGFKYFLVWNIPYKKINVIIKKPVPEEEDEEETTEPENPVQNNNQNRGVNIQRENVITR